MMQGTKAQNIEVVKEAQNLCSNCIFIGKEWMKVLNQQKM